MLLPSDHRVNGSTPGKRFNEQLQAYWNALRTQATEGSYYTIEQLSAGMGVTVTRAQMAALMQPPGESGLAPSPEFITKFIGLLKKEHLFPTPSHETAFTQEAGATLHMAQKRGWPILNVAPRAAGASYAAKIADLTARAYNPKGLEDKQSCQQMLEECYRQQKPFSEFIETVMKQWHQPDAVAFAKSINHCLKRAAKNKAPAGQISADMLRQWRKDEHRGLSRAPIESVALFCQAFGLDDEHQRMIWRMMRGRFLSLADYNQMEAQARETGDMSVLARGLLEASGIPASVIQEKAGVYHVMKHVNGLKFDSADQARAFVRYAYPASLRTGEQDDEDIIARQEAATKLLSDHTALPPLCMAKLEGKQTAREMLDETRAQGGHFGDFMKKLEQEWNVTPEELKELIAYNYRQSTGREGIVWPSTLRAWQKKAAQAGFSPDGETIAVFAAGLGLDKADEHRLWRIMRGREPQNLDTLLTTAQTGDTGPLVKELAAASGIPPERLRATIASQLHSWQNGVKIARKEDAERFFEGVYPARLLSTGEPDSERIARREAMVKACVYVPSVSESVKENRRDAAAKTKREEAARVQAQLAEKPFAAMLEETCREGNRWDHCLNLAKERWGVSSNQLCDLIDRGSAPGDGVKRPKFNAVFEWLSSPDVTDVSPRSVGKVVKAFGLDKKTGEDPRGELHELMVWKAKGGRYLQEGELEDALAAAEKGSPETLVKLLLESAGIREGRFKELAGVTQIEKWESGHHISRTRDRTAAEVARRVVEITMAAERWRMDEETRKAFDTVTQPRMLQALTGRANTIADILFPAEGASPANGHDLIQALCGPKGIKTVSDTEFAAITGIGEWEARQVRRGSHVLTRPQGQRLLAHYECPPQLQEPALEILSVRQQKKGRSPARQEETA